MKRLKSNCPFRGYGNRVAFIATLMAPLTDLAAITLSETVKAHYIMPITLAAFALTFIIAYLILNHKNSEERYLIEQAAEPHWEAPDDWVYFAVKEKYKMPWLEIGVVSFIIAVFLLFFGIKIKDLKTLLPPLTVGVGVILMWIIICAVIKSRWDKLDETAECTILEAHHVYTVKRYGRRRTYLEEYYVFYTIDGRIVLKKELPDCNKVCIIKFNGMITYVEYAEKRRYNKSRY